ncbi:hypothetical protein QO058_00230 [Bosea vestrisii]|uniref:hypothetical protein n=1 Tax=Bosea vestrisii TaxID=151416 RepID=UPI0024DF7F2D|nr:hypothetical protein [Bosea vestrisii]WID96762.1 hypothetical protein QO058_00230 [Bosea vestrisii]
MAPLVIVTLASAIVGMGLYVSLVWRLRGGYLAGSHIIAEGVFAGLFFGVAGYKTARWLGLGATAAGAGW